MRKNSLKLRIIRTQFYRLNSTAMPRTKPINIASTKARPTRHKAERPQLLCRRKNIVGNIAQSTVTTYTRHVNNISILPGLQYSLIHQLDCTFIFSKYNSVVMGSQRILTELRNNKITDMSKTGTIILTDTLKPQLYITLTDINLREVIIIKRKRQVFIVISNSTKPSIAQIQTILSD